MGERASRRLARLAEELEENGLPLGEMGAIRDILLEEVDHALRPPVHERRISSEGAILEPTNLPAIWSEGTQLTITRSPLGGQPLSAARRFVDGLSSWLLRRTDRDDEWIIFDRPAGSERDLVVLVRSFGATIVQRHPSGSVRVAGDFGVLRWELSRWHHERPIGDWVGALTEDAAFGDPGVVEAMLTFAIHDLGSVGIGALLIYRPMGEPGPQVEERLAVPPPLRIRRATDLAPLRHALAQVDGAAVFDHDGRLRQLGVRLVPSLAAERVVDALRGTRHTSGRRYSYDDPYATVIAVSEDGPITVFRHGEVFDAA